MLARQRPRRNLRRDLAVQQHGSIEGPRNYLSLLVNRALMEGFVVFDYAARYAEGMQALAGWAMSGKLKAREDIVEGLETFPDTF